MSYRILKTNNKQIKEVSDEVIDTETVSGIGLIGRLTPNYGETQSNNFVHLVENFANSTFPENSLDGQLCYKKKDSDIDSHQGELYLCVNEDETDDKKKWKKMPIVYIGEVEPDNSSITGDMWYDKKEHEFKMYDEEIAGDNYKDGWITIGPNNFNDIKEVIDENDSITSESEIDETNIVVYDFDNLNIIEQENKNIGYLLTLQVIGKEVIKKTEENSNVTPIMEYGCYITGWKIQAVVNCYRKSNSEIIYEIVDQPDYELIGTNKRDWTIKLLFDNNEKSKLMLNVKGKPRNTYSNNTLKWKFKLEMLKVS